MYTLKQLISIALLSGVICSSLMYVFFISTSSCRNLSLELSELPVCKNEERLSEKNVVEDLIIVHKKSIDLLSEAKEKLTNKDAISIFEEEIKNEQNLILRLQSLYRNKNNTDFVPSETQVMNVTIVSYEGSYRDVDNTYSNILRGYLEYIHREYYTYLLASSDESLQEIGFDFVKHKQSTVTKIQSLTN